MVQYPRVGPPTREPGECGSPCRDESIFDPQLPDAVAFAQNTEKVQLAVKFGLAKMA